MTQTIDQVDELVLFRTADREVGAVEIVEVLRRSGRLPELAQRFIDEQAVKRQCAEAGISPSDAELQAAADDFRSRHGLHRSVDADAWLTERGMSIFDLEEQATLDVLRAKLRDAIPEQEVETHFAQFNSHFNRVELTVLPTGTNASATAIVEALRAGRSARDLAAENGIDPSIATPRWFRRSELTTVIAGEAFKAGPGDVIGPLPGIGVWICAVVGRVEVGVLDDRTRREARERCFELWLAKRRTAIEWM